jgi:alkanesulfonate monooxygenase SsuD/methylene tetrahydromethanopterin reductase-like flavin-dependent oxidoreductase (luciferase family)
VLHLYGQPEDPAYLALQEGFADRHPWFSVRRLGGRTHFAMIETPAEVAAAIDEFVAAG